MSTWFKTKYNSLRKKKHTDINRKKSISISKSHLKSKPSNKQLVTQITINATHKHLYLSRRDSRVYNHPFFRSFPGVYPERRYRYQDPQGRGASRGVKNPDGLTKARPRWAALAATGARERRCRRNSGIREISRRARATKARVPLAENSITTFVRARGGRGWRAFYCRPRLLRPRGFGGAAGAGRARAHRFYPGVAANSPRA